VSTFGDAFSNVLLTSGIFLTRAEYIVLFPFPIFRNILHSLIFNQLVSLWLSELRSVVSRSRLCSFELSFT